MGIIYSSCNSSSATSVATAMVILQDGQLQEFSTPVRVSHVLQKSPTCFLCDSDDMDFGGFVRGVHGDEELQLGQIYFVLPLSWLNKPLPAEDMAALAVRASMALRTRRRKRRFGCGCKRVNQVLFTIKKDVKPGWMGSGGSGGRGYRQNVRRRRGRGGGGRGGDRLTTRLSVILEDEYRSP